MVRWMFEKIFSYVKQNWYSPFACLIINGCSLYFLLSNFYKYDIAYILGITKLEAISKLTIIELIIVVFSLLILTLLWRLTTLVPKKKKNKIGIVIAIKTENKEEKIKLKNDLIETFKEKLNLRGKKAFHIIEYPEYYSTKIQNNKDIATIYYKKSKAHFIIFGILKKRMSEGKEQYCFKLDFGVRHALIPIDISKQFSQEMVEISPLKVRFPLEDELKGFDITKEWLTFAVEYIIGVAAYLTSDVSFSSEILSTLYDELRQVTTNIPAIIKLKRKTKYRLLNSLSLKLIHDYNKYRKTKDENIFDELNLTIEKISLLDPHNYSSRLTKAVLLFLRDRDIDQALSVIKKIRQRPNNTWLYSTAFLYAYKGDMPRAISAYKKAFKGTPEAHVPEECEVFMQDILKEEPGKYQLWFCSGLINHRVKKDLMLAKDDFEKFLTSGDQNEFTEERRLAKIYLTEIKERTK